MVNEVAGGARAARLRPAAIRKLSKCSQNAAVPEKRFGGGAIRLKGRGTVKMDVSAETLRRTSLGGLKAGDPVNLASRLEQINKTYDTKIMISQIVLDKIGDKFLARPIDIVHVKGKHEKIKIFIWWNFNEIMIDLSNTIENK